MIRLPRFRARTASSALVVGAILFAACGSDDASSDTSDPAGTVQTTDDTATDDTATDDTATDDTGTDGTAAEETPVDRPVVDSLPTVPVTELGVTVIEPGSGPEAAEGDTVIVDYTGVRSADGTEFDNSYDSGQPFPVAPLGDSGTVEGFDQGLVGVQAGSTVQLDIPSELAYGDQPPSGDVIKAGDDLTFLVEVRAVIPGTTADQAPDVTVEPTSGTTELESTDLVVGTGAEAVDGSSVAVQYLAFNGADGSQVDNGWERGVPLVLTLGSGQYFEGFEEGITGMKVGGRRQVVIPGDIAFGGAGNESLGLPAGADLVMVFDLLSVF
jgi:peptidylprolyl isomerase